MELLAFKKLGLFNDESDDDGSGSGSPGTCTFPFCSGKSVGSVCEFIGRASGVGSGVFVATVIESIGDVVLLVIFAPKGFKSKDGRLVDLFCRSKY